VNIMNCTEWVASVSFRSVTTMYLNPAQRRLPIPSLAFKMIVAGDISIKAKVLFAARP